MGPKMNQQIEVELISSRINLEKEVSISEVSSINFW